MLVLLKLCGVSMLEYTVFWSGLASRLLVTRRRSLCPGATRMVGPPMIPLYVRTLMLLIPGAAAKGRFTTLCTLSATSTVVTPGWGGTTGWATAEPVVVVLVVPPVPHPASTANGPATASPRPAFKKA